MRYDLEGYNTENLIKVLHYKKIKIYNLSRNEHNHISFEIDDKDEKKVKRYVANFKFKKTLSGIKRLPKFLLANIGIIIGLFIGIIFSIFASAYTWQIIVYGTKDLSKNEIIQVLNDNGVKTGKINTKSSEEIESILLNKYDRIAQVSVIKEGTAIIINLSEKLVYTEEIFEPIKAKYNGIIKLINVVTGTINVKVGDYVNVGDVLVLPFNINSDGEKVSVKPLAEIKGEIFKLSKCELAKEEQVLVRTKRKCVEYKYKFKNHNLFSGKNKNSFALFETVVYNENVSGLIPINRDVLTHYELQTETVVHDFNIEKESLIQKSKDEAYKNLPIGEILEEKSETQIVENKMFAITYITIFGIIND